MPHDHPHEGGHHHHHQIDSANINRAFWVGIYLNTAFIIIEFAAGFYYNSLALLSDAGHNLSDVASLGLSLFAFKLAKAKANNRYTYGYRKGTVLASLANAVILLVAVGSIGWEAIQRFMHPEATKGMVISIVAGIGIFINAISAMLFFRNKDKDLNVKGAYLHLAVDALVSIGVVIAGIIISFTGIQWIDPLISLVIMVIVVFSTWNLLKESLRLSMDAVPGNIQVEKIIETAMQVPGVKDLHHVHIWAMSTTMVAMTGHLLVDENKTMAEVVQIKEKVKHALLHEGIQHSTLETEMQPCREQEHDC